MKKSAIATGLVIVGLAGLAAISYRHWFQTYNIAAASMAPTLIQGDKILAWKITQPAVYERGELILFRHTDPVEEIYVKRIIAIGSDVVEYQGQRLTINGKPLVRTPQPDPWTGADMPRWLQGNTYLETNQHAEYEILIMEMDIGPGGSLTVPAHHVFVMGDNRNQSRDSRFIGPVPTSSIIGRPAIRWERIGNGLQ